MSPILEKVAIWSSAILGGGTGIFFTSKLVESHKNIRDMLISQGHTILETDPIKDSEDYKKWEKLSKELFDHKNEDLKDFLKDLGERPSYEILVEKLSSKCKDLLRLEARDMDSDEYEDAEEFCTEHKDNWFTGEPATVY